MCGATWDMPHVILFVSITRSITFKVVVCINAYMTMYTKKLTDFYIVLYSQPGNLGQCSVTISTLFLFISLVTSIIRASVHALHAVDGDPIMLSYIVPAIN